MEHISKLYWDRCFEAEFLRKKGASFQAFFTRIMELLHPDDFTQIKPWGNIGDEKCDGWLASEKRLFQVYAPEEMEKGKTETKMECDFAGAEAHWRGRFNYWTLVHNSSEGIPPFVLKKIQEFNTRQPGIKSSIWGYAELREQLWKLGPDSIAVILGPPITIVAMQSVRFDDVTAVLQHIQTTEIPANADLRPVPANKIQHNALSDDVVAFLRLGMQKASLVAEFFARYHDPRYGDALAYQFSNKYAELSAAGYCPDDIFWQLRGFAGANDAKSDKEQAAALAIIAHLFEQCDIFERPVDMLAKEIRL